MTGLQQTHDASANEIALAYEKAVRAGDTKHAGNIRYAHADLTKRFNEIDAHTTVSGYA